MWLSSDSLNFVPVFIEIEAPSKPWLTASGQQSHQLTQAVSQLDEWTEFFEQPGHRDVFYEIYDVPAMLRRRKWDPVSILIYGRASENPERVARMRRRLSGPRRLVMPYDTVKPREDQRDYPCVKKPQDSRYVAVTVPPTTRLGTSYAEEWALIDGKPRAAADSEWASPERRAFLAERFAYWDGWAAGDRGITSGELE